MVYVASNKELKIFGLVRPSATPKRMSLMLTQAESARPSIVPDTGPVHWGTIRAVEGSKVTLELRDGRKITVDVSKIMPRATSDFGAIGRSLAVAGKLDSNSVLTATGAWRVKGPAFFGPDRDD
jgi:hypothetical protein